MAGSGGANTWPAYMQNTHLVALTGEQAAEDVLAHMGTLNLDLAQDVHDAKLYNPFASALAYDPEALLDSVQDRFDTFDAVVGDLDEEADWLSIYTKAKNGVILDYTVGLSEPDDLPTEQPVIVEDVDVEAAVAEFDRENIPTLMRSVNRLAGSMVSINAVHSSAFILGLAKMEGDHIGRVDKYKADLKTKSKLNKQTLQVTADMKEREIKSLEAREKRALVAANKRADKETERVENMTIAQQRADAVIRMVHLLSVKVDAGKTATGLQAEIGRLTGDAYHRQADRDLEISEHDAMWDLHTYTPLGNFMAAISGAPMQPKGLSKGQAIISGALSGAAAGASIGSAVPGIGTAIGAGVGAIAGATAGAL